MNKNIRRMLCMLIVCAMALTGACFTAAAETQFEVTATVDYDTSVVTVEVNTPAQYVQKISLVMYEKDTAPALPTDLLRALDVYTDGSGTATIQLQLAQDDPAGYLTISAAGNGTLASVSRDTCDIYFESQKYIKEVTLPDIESASRTEIETLLFEKADMLGIDKEDFAANADTICDLFINIRNEDYAGKCNDMGTVVNILSGIQLIRDINAASTEAECQTLCEDESTLLTLNVNDGDYKNKEDDVYELFFANIKNDAPNSITDVKDDLFQSIAIANFNKLDATKVGPVVTKYISHFGITSEEYEQACTLYTANEINKAFVGRDFTLPAEVIEAFDAVVKNAEENSGTSDGTDSSGGSFSGGGGGGGGGKSENKSASTDLMNNDTNKEILPEFPSGGAFTDVPETHWAYEAINGLAGMNVVDGVGFATFDPDSYVTREAFVKMLVMAFDIYDETALTIFTDMHGHWANIYVASAQVYGIVSGIDNATFGAGMQITRQDAAVMLDRLRIKKDITFENVNETKEFADSALVADYAKESIGALQQAGVINGVSETEFQPTAPLTRAQAAKIIYGVVSR